MASKKTIKQTLHTYVKPNEVINVLKLWENKKDPEDVVSYDVGIEYLQNIISKIQILKNKKLDKLKENWFKCPHCGKLTLLKDLQRTTKKETKEISTYTDSGYGDDDRWGLASYLNTYKICSHCKETTFEHNLFLGIEEEWDRYGNIYKNGQYVGKRH